VQLALLAHARLESPTEMPASGIVVVGSYEASTRAQLVELHRGAGGHPSSVEFVAKPSDELLAALYRNALCTVCPPPAGGLALPLVEAVASGCPVLAADCKAQSELLRDPDVLFGLEDPGQLAEMLGRLLLEPGRRAALLHRQEGLPDRFAEREVADRVWTRLIAECNTRPTSVRPRAPRAVRPRLAFLTPYPPDASGVADYSKACLASLAACATVDVFTNASPIEPDRNVRRFAPVSALPYVASHYDRVVSVVGNSHFHFDILELLAEHGGACIEHDNRLLELYMHLRGLDATAQMATRSLGRDVDPEEIGAWARSPHLAPIMFLDEVARVASPLIVHSRALREHVQRMYRVEAANLPFCVYRAPAVEELSSESRRLARARLRLPDAGVVVVTLGYVGDAKAPAECIRALRELRDRGLDASLHIVGGFVGNQKGLEALSRELGLGGFVTTTGRVSEQVYRDYLLAADFGIQLRTNFLGGLSGALQDCIAAGLPTVANEDLAEAMEAPDYVLRVPDRLSPTLVAERIMKAHESARHRIRDSGSRRRYLREHHFDLYAERLLEVLQLR
jgi:glycosyltransferase involved in cell wall biosynthesis